MQINQVHIDQALPDISVAYEQALPFVSEEVFPVVGVQKKSDKYFKFSKQHFQIENDSIAPDGEARRIALDLEPLGYFDTEGHALEIPMTDDVKDNADPGADLQIEWTQKLTEKLRLAQERDSANLISTANIPQNITASGGTKWSDYVNSNPIAAVDQYKETIMQSIGVEPNTLLLPRPVFRVVRNHPQVYNRIMSVGTAKEPLTEQQVAEAFGVSKVIVPKIVYKTSTEGQADALSFLWGNIALLFYCTGNPGRRTPNFGYTFVWTKQTYDIKVYRDERHDADVYKGKKYRAVVLIEPNAGFLFNSII